MIQNATSRSDGGSMDNQVGMDKYISLGALTRVQGPMDSRPLLMIDNGRADQMFPSQDTRDTKRTPGWIPEWIL
jgi:hypothetical protein